MLKRVLPTGELITSVKGASSTETDILFLNNMSTQMEQHQRLQIFHNVEETAHKKTKTPELMNRCLTQIKLLVTH